MRLTRVELEKFRNTTVPDLIGPGVRLLFVGINPGLWTAAVGSHFARRGNRFYPALSAAGLIDRLIDASAGYHPDDRQHLLDRGIGITNLATRATARANELTPAELVAGARTLAATVQTWQPTVVAVAGITAYRTAFGQRSAAVGRQTGDLAGSQLWVVPNPSGLNAHDTVTSLAAAYRQVGIAAGLVPPISRDPDRPGSA